MAKVIKYNLCSIVTKVIGVDEEVDEKLEQQTTTVTEEILTPVTLPWSEAHEEIAKLEAHNGEYTIEDDGIEPTPAEKITEQKKRLAATDYKVIKCAERLLLGEELPYDVETLHAERQAIRDEINRLEEE